MKRKIFAILLSISFSAIALAGCGSKKVEDANQKVEITATPAADEEGAAVKDEVASIEPTEEPEETQLPIDNSQLAIETEPVEPTENPEETEIPEETSTPEATEEPKTTEIPEVTEKPVITTAPTTAPTEAPKPVVTATPVPTQLPIDNSQLPIATATPAPTPVPTPEPTVAPTPTPEPVVEECGHAGLQYTGRILREEEWSIGRCGGTIVYTELICPHCGETFEDNGGGFNESHPVTENPGSYPATCTTDGYYAGKQCDCGQSKLDPYVIPAHGHRYEITQLEDKFHPGEELYPDDPAMAAISGWTEYHYQEKCEWPSCGHIARDWWSLDATEAW